MNKLKKLIYILGNLFKAKMIQMSFTFQSLNINMQIRFPLVR